MAILKKKPKVRAAVQLGSLQQLDGQAGLEEGAADDQVVHRDRHGQNQGPQSVERPKS